MKLHPRFDLVRKIEAKISPDLSELTDGELILVCSRLLATRARFMIRDERHPGDPDTKGDEA